MHHRLRSRSLVAVLTLAALVGAACSDDDETAAGDTSAADTSSEDSPGDTSAEDMGDTDMEDSDDPDAAAHNDADVEFAVNMIPHHEQAVEMSQLAPDRAVDDRVIDLAARIEDAQSPEIEEMRDLLDAFGESEDMGDMDMDTDEMGAMTGMAGMLSQDELDALEEAGGVDFDLLYLEGMIAHHDGAIEMAEVELAEGEHPDALALAQSIRSAQEAEIEEMELLLADIEALLSSGRG